MFCNDNWRMKVDDFLSNFFSQKINFIEQGDFLFLNDLKNKFLVLKSLSEVSILDSVDMKEKSPKLSDIKLVLKKND